MPDRSVPIAPEPSAPPAIESDVQQGMAQGTVKGTRKAASKLLHYSPADQKAIVSELAHDKDVNKTEVQRLRKILGQSTLGKRATRGGRKSRKGGNKSKRITRRR